MRISPPARLGPLSEDERSQILQEVLTASATGMAWKEKLRRYASVYGRHLDKESKARFGSNAGAHLAWIADLLCSPNPLTGLPDAASINGALFAADAVKNEAVKSRIRDHAEELRAYLLTKKGPMPAAPSIGAQFLPDVKTWKIEAHLVEPVVIICPMQWSLYTLALMQLCRKFNVPIAAVILRKLDIARFQQEFSRDGMRLIRKIWRKLVLRADENKDISDTSLRVVYEKLACEFSDVRLFSRHMQVPIIEVSNLTDLPAQMTRSVARMALFTGGGLVGTPMLEHFAKGIINVHMGALPQYKGMDVVQATILDGCFDSISMSAHLMAEGLDKGPVISVCKTSSDHYRSLGALRNEMSALSPLMCFDACLGLASGRYHAQPQPKAGRQYFILHEVMTQIIAEVLRSRFAAQGTQSELQQKVESVGLEDLLR